MVFKDSSYQLSGKQNLALIKAQNKKTHSFQLSLQPVSASFFFFFCFFWGGTLCMSMYHKCMWPDVTRKLWYSRSSFHHCPSFKGVRTLSLCHFIRYTFLLPCCLQNGLNSSWYKFNKMLTFLSDFTQYCHDASSSYWRFGSSPAIRRWMHCGHKGMNVVWSNALVGCGI